MEYSFVRENREFMRIQTEIPVRYRFLCSHLETPELKVVYEGATANLSGGGILLVGTVPHEQWIPELLMEKILIGVEMQVPDLEDPIRALTRTAWVETVDVDTMKCHLGLKFKEITQRSQDRIFQYIIDHHLR
jgi:c-di-GMP-binding flagellar brake protein YcgR